MQGILPPPVYAGNLARLEDYELQLHSEAGAQHLAYLTEDRGLTPDTIRHFRLGAVIDPDPQDLFAAGRICIPHFNAAGAHVLRFRALPGVDGPKYWQPAGSRVGIFNVTELITPRPTIYVCEGEIDTMTLVQCGLPAVGFPGAQSWQDHHRYLFDGYERVVIAMDHDEAGQAFGEKVAAKVPGPVPVLMPAGHDVNSFFQQHGRAALLRHLKVKGS